MFSGKLGENVDTFLENFELEAIINDWDETQKIILLPLYLKETAGKFFKLMKIKNIDIKWEEAKLLIKNKFTVIGNNKLLRVQLNNRKLEKEESLNEFVINVTELCNKVDPDMKEEEICEKILNGIPNEIYEKIEILDNSNIEKLTDNLVRYELAKMLRSNEDKTNTDVNKLNEEIKILKNHIKQLDINNMEQNRQYNQSQSHSNFYNQYNRNYNPRPRQYYNNQNNIANPNYQNIRFNNNYHSQNPRFNYTYNPQNPNQNTNQQFPPSLHQGPRPYIHYQNKNIQNNSPACYQCGMVGHLKRECNNQKKLALQQIPGSVMENKINTSDRSEYKADGEKLTHVIYNCYENNEMNKVKHKIEILGKINDQYKLLLLDTGASRTVIHKDIIKFNNIINKNDIYLETANNSKLNVLGSTMIKIEIGPIIIDHEAIIIDNLCSTILLGLDFIKRVQTILNLKDGFVIFNFNNQLPFH